MDGLKAAFEQYCWKNGAPYPVKEFNDLPEEATKLKEYIVAVKDIRKESILKTVELSKEEDEEKQVEIQSMLLDNAKLLIKCKKEAAVYFKSRIDAIEAEKSEQIDNAKAEVVSVQASIATANIPKYEYDYEVVNFAKVPDAFKMINSAAVEAYIKTNKDNLANGEVRDGIRFIRSVKTVRLS